MQAVNNIFKLFALVLQMNHVGFGKNRAATGHVGRFFTFKAQLDEVI